MMHNPPVSKKRTLFGTQETGTKQEKKKCACHSMPSDKAPPLQTLTETSALSSHPIQ
jgi:hypothetical protein